MGRITPFIAALLVAMAAGCKRERSEPASTPKTTEPATPAAAEEEAESALDVARDAKATADSALATAREAQAAARRTTTADTPGAWWNRALADAHGATAPAPTTTSPGMTPADRNAATPEALGTAPPAGTGAADMATEDADRISVAGRVTESGPDRIVVEPIVGAPLAAQVDSGTSVTIDGHAAAPAQLTPGTQVRLLYRLDGARVVAERVDVQR